MFRFEDCLPTRIHCLVALPVRAPGIIIALTDRHRMRLKNRHERAFHALSFRLLNSPNSSERCKRLLVDRILASEV
jgi:hypothetical protein